MACLEISESAAEAIYSLKCLVPEEFLAEQMAELASLKQIEAI